MPYIKIEQRGFENFTGMFGIIAFKEGVSVEDVPVLEAERLGASLRIVNADTGEQVSLTHRMVVNRNKSTDDLGLKTQQTQKVEKKTEKKTEKVAEKPTNKIPAPDYTKEELENLADKEGISGLRKVAKEYGVSGKSVVAIIDQLLELKG